MSADNWTTCPRCAARKRKQVQDLATRISESYGKIPIEEFDELRATRTRLENEELERTVREDYEFWGFEDGEFNAKYRARCTACGFEHEFNHHETLSVSEDIQ